MAQIPNQRASGNTHHWQSFVAKSANGKRSPLRGRVTWIGSLVNSQVAPSPGEQDKRGCNNGCFRCG